MKTIRLPFIVLVIVFTVIFSSSCIKNNLTAEVDLGEVALNIPIYLVPSEEEDIPVMTAIAETDNFRPFIGRLNLYLNDTTIFPGFAEYQTLFKQLSISNVRIQIKKENALKGSSVSEIKSTAYNNFNDSEISSYEREGIIDFETEYFDDSKLTNFVKDIFASLEEDKVVNIVL